VVRQSQTASAVADRKSPLNTALHRIASTQARYHPPAREILQRRRASVDTKTESIPLKPRLSDVVYRVLLADASSTAPPHHPDRRCDQRAAAQRL
jgi:hypothetical protein